MAHLTVTDVVITAASLQEYLDLVSRANADAGVTITLEDQPSLTLTIDIDKDV